MAHPEFYAHAPEAGSTRTDWHVLRTHLETVASLARRFADAFGAGEWGYIAGLWHDIGKYQQRFQDRLRGQAVSVEHSGPAAALAMAADARKSRPIAFAAAGHHGGLPNPRMSGPGLPSPLAERLEKAARLLAEIWEDLPPAVRDASLPALPTHLTKASPGAAGSKRLTRSIEFWTRFLFSALVDADWLDTESYFRPDIGARRSAFESIELLRKRLDGYIDHIVAGLDASVRASGVNQARAHVLDACRKAAAAAPGVFSLTVPTGGGKTLSAMSFALRHAVFHGLRRVIVVIPYTSIIEQNAHEYRKALGAANVVEHHSNLDVARVKQALGEEMAGRHELATENWDAPVIVTTSVQFFESLFANGPSRCRKLHNIARSVIILDEVQTVPPHFLLSIVEALEELTNHYGCSLVLSTATPPSLKERQRFENGLRNVRDIVPESEALDTKLARVRYHWPEQDAPPVAWESLASELARHEQVLCIVHRRADARLLAEMLAQLQDEESVHHLSALMCPEHRTLVLEGVKGALISGRPCRVVSTQLVEAGVDVDFPVVYRAMAGLDSIVQAAGRCNREGRHDRGDVFLFRAPTRPPAGTLRKAMESAETLLHEVGNGLQPDCPTLIDRFFRMLYSKETLDARQIQTHRQELNFATVDRNFRLIEDGFSRPVIVPYGEAPALVADVQRDGPSREARRRLQRYVVSIYPNAFDKLQSAGALEEVVEGLFFLSSAYADLYSERFGLTPGDDTPVGRTDLIV
ncbi:MAG: CRISPR-associated endonuclease Cas3'' [Candidatus Brocadiaceae bacterium]|nr:CRISPR-associated endonuclease Cas3'' [Candidatus Brocadiaceae bacterium]